MPRVNDVGGIRGFGAVDYVPEQRPFEAVWEARTWAVNAALLQAGLYNLAELRYAIERLDPAVYLSMPYYGRRLLAVEMLLVEKGYLEPGALSDPSAR